MKMEAAVDKSSDGAIFHQHTEARKNLLKAMISKFSSTPIETISSMDEEQLVLESVDTASTNEVELRQQLDDTETSTYTALTKQERDYLSTLLESGDAFSMRTASQVLQDESVFPAQHHELLVDDDTSTGQVTPSARSSELQQHLFRIHESDQQGGCSLHFLHKNSILSMPSSESIMFPRNDEETDHVVISERIPPPVSEMKRPLPPTPKITTDNITTDPLQNSEPDATEGETVGPFDDVTSWLDGSLGVEVGGDGSVVPTRTSSNPPAFRILGTTADDVSCHPHVLSPPLMESLLQFVPETSNDGGGSFNFWLKYSLVRDGHGLWNFLRQTRASTLTFLAIETDTGHVLGAFTNQPWRLSVGWYGGADAFLWKLRRSRVDHDTRTTPSVLEQVQAESEVQVYPYRKGHKAVQYCSKQCLMLGNAEIIPSPVYHDPETKPCGLAGTHHGHGLYLARDLLSGSTSTSETFGNPCLIDSNQRGLKFRVANIEVWTLTPHSTVEEAEQSELSNLFLERADPRLNVYSILSGGPI